VKHWGAKFACQFIVSATGELMRFLHMHVRSGEGAAQHLISEKWISQLSTELEKEGIALPER